ncbi:MAG TPA: hypothetical protein VG675_04670 [Bryobacteraceae bacterium]|nr:hypothetical protein [Bryobacteraceae bacterium]
MKIPATASQFPSGSRFLDLRESSVLLALLLALAAFYVATLRPGQAWGDDFAMYLMHARNLAQGVPYNQTGYIYNPELPEVGPRSYPPLYPLLLSFIYRVRGLDLSAMKVLVILLFLSGLYVLARLLRHVLPLWVTLLITAGIALNPYILGMKESLGSDLPFLLFCYSALYVIDLCDRDGWQSRWHLALLVLAVYLSYAMRTVGIVVVPAAIILVLVRKRGIPRRVIEMIAVLCIILLIHILWFRGAASYLDQLNRLSIATVSHNLSGYFWSIRHLLWPLGSVAPSLLLAIVMIALGLWGYAIRAGTGLSILEVFSPLYAVAILLWASDEDLRFFLPLIPLWLFYAAVALREISQRAPIHAMRLAAAPVLIAALAVSSGTALLHADSGPIREGLLDPEFQQLCSYIRSSTPADSVFLFRKPRILALYTDRHAAVSSHSTNDSHLWLVIGQLRAGYIILAPEFTDDYSVLNRLVHHYPGSFREVFHDPEFKVLRIQQQPK